MRSTRLFLISGLVTCGALALIYSSCGGDTSEGIDAGKDGSNNPDTTPPPPTDTGIPDDTGTGTDSGIDTGVDAGPLCTSSPCVVQIAAGHRHVCARINDGTVRCWGRNARGEVGTGALDGGGFDPANRPTPVQVAVTGVTHVTPSRAYIIGNNNDYGSTCAITGTGPQCWGDNQGAQLGYGAGFANDAAVLDTNPHPNPAAVQGLSGTITNMSQGSFHGCAVDSTNVMSCWGWNNYYPLARVLNNNGAANQGAGGVYTVTGGDGGIAVTSTQAAGGGSFTLALLAGGTVASWGDNYYGELGRVTTGGNPDARPQAVGGLSSVTQIDAGYVFACALTSAGSLYCWGDNSAGQLGRGLTGQTSTTPTAIAFPGGKLVKQFATGGEHTCTVMNDNSVYCWGDNGYQQLGVNQDGGAQPGLANTPQEVVGFTGKVLQVTAGGSFSCALIEGGSVMCWGSNVYGQLGRGPDGGVGTLNPVPGAVTF